MGDHADDAIDYGMSHGFFNGFGLRRRSAPRSVTCCRCHERSLTWKETREGWRLFKADGSMHVCAKENVVDEFEDLTAAPLVPEPFYNPPVEVERPDSVAQIILDMLEEYEERNTLTAGEYRYRLERLT